MPRVRYIGRDPIYFGKTLFDICARLAGNGVGRVVTRACAQGEPKGGKIFRITDCAYDLTPSGEAAKFRVGRAFGLELGPNGLVDRPVEIVDADLDDWRLVRRKDEDEFVAEIEKLKKIHPKVYSASTPPPVLEMALKRK